MLRYCLPALLFIAIATACVPVRAASNEDVRAEATRYLQDYANTLPGTASITVAPINTPRAMLSACTAIEAFIPPGQPRWGRISVGVRCKPPGKGAMFVSTRLTLMADYVVVAQPVLAGQILSASDLKIEHGELSLQSPDTITALEAATGRTARQPLSKGQTLRAAFLQAAMTVRPGQEVKVIARGPGFSVSNAGHAINVAAAGELVRVKLDDGRILTGLLSSTGIVEVQE